MTQTTYQVQSEVFIDACHAQAGLKKITGHLPIIVIRKWVVQVALALKRVRVHREAVQKRLADIVNVACVSKKFNLIAESQRSQERCRCCRRRLMVLSFAVCPVFAKGVHGVHGIRQEFHIKVPVMRSRVKFEML